MWTQSLVIHLQKGQPEVVRDLPHHTPLLLLLVKLIDQPERSVQPNSEAVLPSTSKLHFSTGNKNVQTIPSITIGQTDKNSQVSASSSQLKFTF
ncbi:hypothetical protein DPMN_054632 [Dreissena polymorpha]|uniref:Uncharacterized protein n=1 Tax=Dreissena polymorpha TaxID=45954 RepID=A0A9D4CP92_DREPO|nr:hypothetical protein DPMN_054632 [Dreissena polymorpha]